MERGFCRSCNKYVVYILLFFICISGAFFRIQLTKIGLPYEVHWDEQNIVLRSMRIMKENDWNPYFFHYPSFMIYSCTAVNTLTYCYLISSNKANYDLFHDLRKLNVHVETGDYIEKKAHSFQQYGFVTQTNIDPYQFLWADRLFVSSFGIASLLIIFLLSRFFFSPSASLISTGLLAFSHFHIMHSAMVTPNVPMTFFVLFSAYFSIKFVRQGQPFDYIAALIMVGVAASVKYNACLSLVFPLWAIACEFFNRKKSIKKELVLLVLIPTLTAIAITPYMILDFRQFITDFGFELYHYKMQGHFQATVCSGKDHLLLMIKLFRDNFSILLCFFSLLGAISALFDKTMRILVLFCMLYMLSMMKFVVFFERNSLVLFPFVCIFFVQGILCFKKNLLQLISKKQSLVNGSSALVNACLILTYLLLQFPCITHCLGVVQQKETRTLLVRSLNNYSTQYEQKNLHIGILEDLKVHPEDLRCLKKKYNLFQIENMDEAIEQCDFMVFGKFEPGSEKHRIFSQKYEEIKDQLELEEIISSQIGFAHSELGTFFSVFPDIYIYRVRPAMVFNDKS